MLSKENLVVPGSDYYIHTPSAQARGLFLYPMIVGRFRYLPGYCLRRSALDSFLVMRLLRGTCQVESGGQQFRAQAGQVVVLDCYAPPRLLDRPGLGGGVAPLRRLQRQGLLQRGGRGGRPGDRTEKQLPI